MGLLGRLFAKKMESMTIESSIWSLELLQLYKSDQVLEIGFGTGALIEMVSRQITDGLVVGLDHSETMVSVASKRNAEAIAAGTVKLVTGQADEMPFDNGQFDKVYAINVIYLWPELQRTLGEVTRVLKKGGKLILYLAPKTTMGQMGLDKLEFFTMHMSEEVEAVVVDLGYSHVAIERKNLSDGPAECVVAIK
jgi:ubiquinone/menaquinone biosynthesis C-methylase UbiE